MRKASVISVGNEVLSGATIDTNTGYLNGKLFSIGINVVSSYTVGDDIDSIVRVLKLASEDGDAVLVTGGLGPTDDDLTREAIAKFLGSELQFDEKLLKRIEKFFLDRRLQMPVTNKVQAYIPAGTKSLTNNVGTAPGIEVQVKGKLIFAMPGVPAEMKQMFEEAVLPELRKSAGEQAIVVRKLNCFGTGESNIAELLGGIMERGRNPLVNSTAQCGVITLHIIATAKTKEKAEEKAESEEELLRGKLGEWVYGTGEQSLAEVVGEKLAGQGKRIAVAESCTGGTLAKLLTDATGASRYFMQGWVTYSNESKISELGVPGELIDKYGAVSREVAESMARCAREKSSTDFAIGITGIAGPSGASEQKPIGLVYISVDSDDKCESKRFIFSGSRDMVRFRAANAALNMVRLQLQN